MSHSFEGWRALDGAEPESPVAFIACRGWIKHDFDRLDSSMILGCARRIQISETVGYRILCSTSTFISAVRCLA
jgi:hypothetical protein